MKILWAVATWLLMLGNNILWITVMNSAWLGMLVSVPVMLVVMIAGKIILLKRERGTLNPRQSDGRQHGRLL